MVDPRSWLRENRSAVAVIAAGAALAAAISGALTRPMGDSPPYRTDAHILASGWSQITYRTPGYPLLLWATGSMNHETHLLFVAQLLMHCLAVGLTVDIARRLGLPAAAGTAIAVLLMLPPVTMQTWLTGSEILSELCVVVTLWAMACWLDRQRTRTLVLLGCAAGAALIVRPALLLIWLPCAVVVWRRSTRRASVDEPVRPAPAAGGAQPEDADSVAVASPAGSRTQAAVAPGSTASAGVADTRPPAPVAGRWRALAVMLAPVVLLGGGLSTVNWVRFDSPGLTPLLAWHLSTRTSEYVELLPASDEPTRSYLVALRDRTYTDSVDHPTPEYLNNSPRADLARVAHRKGVALDKYLLHLDLTLIIHHPFDYAQAVVVSAGNIWQFNSEPGGFGTTGPVGWITVVIHDCLALFSVCVFAIVLAAAFRRALEPKMLRIWLAGLGIFASNAIVSIMVESGTPRLLAPTYPVVALLLVSGVWIARAERRAGSATALDVPRQ